MMPQQAPCYPAAVAAGAPPVYGQPGFYSPPNLGLNVPVGIPAGVAPVYGSVAHPGNAVPGATLVHVGNAAPGVAQVHMGNMVVGNSHMGNVPAQSQHFFVPTQQSSFVQPSGSNNAYGSPLNAHFPGQWQEHPRHPCSPPPSSFPPGFEPSHNKNNAVGVPSQGTSNNCATGGMVMNTNQHQRHFHQQQQQQQQKQQERQPQQHSQPDFQHQQHSQLVFQHQQQFLSQPPNMQQHPPGQQHSHLHQHQRQHQYFQNQSLHPLQHQHQQQHTLQQSQHPHHNQHHSEHHHPHHQFHCQNNSLNQHQQPHPVQQQHQYEHQQHQHLHSQSQPFMQNQPQNFQQANLLPQLQLQPQPQPQPQPGQQVQPVVQLHQPNFQTCPVNGVAIGVPVMPTHSYVDATSVHNIPHSQQPTPAWQQPIHLENSLSTTQLMKSNGLESCPIVVSPQGELRPNGQQATNIHTKDPCEQAHSISSSMPKSHSGLEGKSSANSPRIVMPSTIPKLHSGLEGMRSANSPRIGFTQINGHVTAGTARPSSCIESNHRNKLSPPRAELRAGRSAGNPSPASRDYQPRSNGQFKSQSNRSFPAHRDKCGDSQHVPQRQRPDFRGKPFSKGLGKTSHTQPLRCEPCDRTFTTSEILSDHLKSHVKCGEEGCLFEAAGKIVKEHKATEHGKVEFQSTYRGRKALALRSMEDKEDIKRWREERKRSYPSAGNILRKAEEKRKREAEGEPVDEEAQQRRQRLMDIIAKQKQLGYQVPEIPSHYFRTQHNRQFKKSRVDIKAGPPTVQEENSIASVAIDRNASKEAGEASPCIQSREASSHAKANGDDNECRKNGNKEAGDTSTCIHDRDASSHATTNDDGNQYHRNGHFKKGHHNKFSSWQDRRKQHQNSRPPILQWQQPSLLSRLLSKDIEAENSQLLQCCRFLVNNGFLQDWPLTSLTCLKHFEWIEPTVHAEGGDLSANVIDTKAELALEAGEYAPTSLDFKHSACREEFYQASDSKEAVGHELPDNKIAALVTCKDVLCLSTDSSGKGKGNEDKELHHADSDKIMGGVQRSWKPGSMSTNLSSQDLEAGEVASGNSESVVEDDEDISQYMNLDVSGADSGCCCD